MATETLKIRRRMTWTWFVLAYSMSMVITASLILYFVTTKLSFSDEVGQRQQYDDSFMDTPIWFVAACYLMSLQFLGCTCYGLFASSGRPRHQRLPHEIASTHSGGIFGIHGPSLPEHHIAPHDPTHHHHDHHHDHHQHHHDHHHESPTHTA